LQKARGVTLVGFLLDAQAEVFPAPRGKIDWLIIIGWLIAGFGPWAAIAAIAMWVMR
jgi:hypothetical protein